MKQDSLEKRILQGLIDYLNDLYPSEIRLVQLLDPKILPQAPQKVEEENWLFRSFLKEQDSEEVDETVHYLHEKLFEQIDCVACSNCCKSITPNLENEDIKRISQYLGKTEKEFTVKYLLKNQSGSWVFNSSPCKFLTPNGCSIYEVRPKPAGNISIQTSRSLYRG